MPWWAIALLVLAAMAAGGLLAYLALMIWFARSMRQ